MADPESEKKSDPDPDQGKKNRIRNTGYTPYFTVYGNLYCKIRGNGNRINFTANIFNVTVLELRFLLLKTSYYRPFL